MLTAERWARPWGASTAKSGRAMMKSARPPALLEPRQQPSSRFVCYCRVNSYWCSQGLAHQYHTILTQRPFRRTTSDLTKSFLTQTSISSVTPKPDLPSCPLLASSSLSLPPTPMSLPHFLLLCLVVGSVHPFSFGGLSVWRAVVSLMFSLCVCVWRARSTSFRYPDGPAIFVLRS